MDSLLVLVSLLLGLRSCSPGATCVAVLPCQADSYKTKKIHILWRLRRYQPNTMSSWLPSEAGNTSQPSARLRYVNSMSCVSCQSRTAKWLNCLPSTFLQLPFIPLDICTFIYLFIFLLLQTRIERSSKCRNQGNQSDFERYFKSKYNESEGEATTIHAGQWRRFNVVYFQAF
jgi:hypothetical protein